MSLASQYRWLPFLPLDHMEGQGSGSMGGGVENGLSSPLFIASTSLRFRFPFPTTPLPLDGSAQRGFGSCGSGAIMLAPSSPEFYSLLFVIWKVSGSWRPVIDLSRLNEIVLQTCFKMESNQLVLIGNYIGYRIVSIDLKNAYLRVPPSRQLQVPSICHRWDNPSVLASPTAPQMFTKVMAPVSVMLHTLGVRILHYLDDWLILASRLEALWARDQVLLFVVNSA